MIRHLLQNRLQANLICWRKLSKAVHGGLGLVNKLKAHSNHNLSGVQVNFDRTDRQLAKVVRGIIYTKRILAISVVSKFILLFWVESTNLNQKLFVRIKNQVNLVMTVFSVSIQANPNKYFVDYFDDFWSYLWKD